MYVQTLEQVDSTKGNRYPTPSPQYVNEMWLKQACSKWEIHLVWANQISIQGEQFDLRRGKLQAFLPYFATLDLQWNTVWKRHILFQNEVDYVDNIRLYITDV